MYKKVKVIPRAKKSEIIELYDNSLKVKLTSPPVKNRANRELIELLASYYGVNKTSIKIVKGEHSREKLIEIKR